MRAGLTIRDLWAAPGTDVTELVAVSPDLVVRELLAVRPLMSAVALVQLVWGDEGPPMTVRDLLTVMPLCDAKTLVLMLGEGAEEMRIRDLQARVTELATLTEAYDAAAPPDLRELLERLRALNGLNVGPLGDRVHLRMEELYYRKGRRTEFVPIRQRHLENKAIEARYRRLKQQLARARDVAQQQRKALRLAPPAASASPLATELARRSDNVGTLRAQLRDAKRTWVQTENRLGELYEPKTQLEAFLESMRLKLLAVLRDPVRYLGDHNRLARLEQRLVVLNQELERDNDLHAALQAFLGKADATRSLFEDQLGRAEDRLRSFWQTHAPTLEVLQQRDEGAAAARETVQMLIERYGEVFPGATLAEGMPLEQSVLGRSKADVSQLLWAPIAALHDRQLLATHLLYSQPLWMYDTPASSMMSGTLHAAAMSSAGYQLDLSRLHDPLALSDMVLHWTASSSLLPRSLLACRSSQAAAQAIARLPRIRRAHARVLFAHLHAVAAHARVNGLSPRLLASVFARLLLK